MSQRGVEIAALLVVMLLVVAACTYVLFAL